MGKDNKKTKRSVTALDIFAVLFVVLCIAAAALRLTLDFGSGGESKPVELGEYLISYRVSSARTTSTRYFEDGTEFQIADGGGVFGVTDGDITVTPAEYYFENPDGTLTLKYYPENGDESLVDIKGTMRVSGAVDTDTGLFMLNGTGVLAPNMELELSSGEIKATVLVTAINKAQ